MSIASRIKSFFTQPEQTAIECYRTKTTVGTFEWRWRAVAANNKTMADSGEGYSRKVDMIRAIARLFPDRNLFVVVDVDR